MKRNASCVRFGQDIVVYWRMCGNWDIDRELVSLLAF